MSCPSCLQHIVLIRYRVGKNNIRCQTYAKQKTISNSNSILILGILVTYSRHNGNCNICAFHEKSILLKTGFLLDCQVLFLLLNGPQIEKGLQFKLIDRFRLKTESSDTLILPFTSKTGQSAAQNRQTIFFKFWFYYK